MFPNVKLTSSSSPKFPKYCKIWSHYEQHVCIENSKRENISVDVCRNIETDFSWYKFIFTQSWMVALDISVKGGQTGLKNSLKTASICASISILFQFGFLSSGTRFSEISPLWQNFKSLGKFLNSLFLLGKLSLLQIVIVANSQRLKNNTAILVTLFLSSQFFKK